MVTQAEVVAMMFSSAICSFFTLGILADTCAFPGPTNKRRAYNYFDAPRYIVGPALKNSISNAAKVNRQKGSQKKSSRPISFFGRPGREVFQLKKLFEEKLERVHQLGNG